MFIKALIFIIIGLFGGVIGGMGMGGGTLLIPLLNIFTGTEQHVAQAINLIAFIPMSIAAIIIHAKNKLINYKYVLWITIPACIFSVVASFIVRMINGRSLGRYFGIFLIVLGLYQLACIVYKFGVKRGVKAAQIKKDEIVSIGGDSDEKTKL